MAAAVAAGGAPSRRASPAIGFPQTRLRGRRAERMLSRERCHQAGVSSREEAREGVPPAADEHQNSALSAGGRGAVAEQRQRNLRCAPWE